MRMRRRQFLSAMIGGMAVLGTTPARSAPVEGLRAGEGVVDITPPLGIELAGFHRPPGQERRVVGIRQSAEVRALVLACNATQVAICSLDILGTSQEMVRRIQGVAAQRTGIPAENIHVVATHDHSMPTFQKLRQWGGMSPEFMASVERRTVEAIAAAQNDLAPAELSLGKCRAPGGSHNRTVTKDATRADADFGPQSTDDQRWLDTMLHTLVFRRAGKSRDLVWYHFSAHAVCYADEQAGPDWPGEVAREIRKEMGLHPSFLQGHIGDVNPGDGSDWRGEIRQTVAAITPALKQAIADASCAACRLPYGRAVSASTCRSIWNVSNNGSTNIAATQADASRDTGWMQVLLPIGFVAMSTAIEASRICQSRSVRFKLDRSQCCCIPASYTATTGWRSAATRRFPIRLW